MGDNGVVKTGSSSAKPPTNDNGGPIIEESQESEEYQQDLQVVLGTAFGVIAVVGLIALAFLLYRTYWARQAALAYGQADDTDNLDGVINVDIEGKSQPTVLLLYAYDCPIHEQVVAALAGFLMESCGVTVSLDLLEENEIVERGIDDWLVDRLQEADYILVLCSLGARLRCSKKKVKFKPNAHRTLPDYFAVAVDYVAEKMRAEKLKGLSLSKFVIAYMEYSTRSDIPPQLEMATQFCLMKDIHKLHTYFNTLGPEADKGDSSSQSSYCENHYQETETGALLKAATEQAKAFFRDNPSWVDERLEQLTPSAFQFCRGAKARKRRQSSLQQPLIMMKGSPPDLNCLPQNTNCTSLSSPNYGQSHHSQHITQSLQETVIEATTCHTLPKASVQHECRHISLGNSGIFQGRQNSLPSSLASSSAAIPFARHAISKSMDSFANDQNLHQDHDGVPCFYCNSMHMDGRPECRQVGPTSMCCLTSTDLSHEPCQTSLGLTVGGLGPSRSQTTVLQAEVHKEWGHSNKDTLEKKSATFTGDPRFCNSDFDLSVPMTPFQSLPPLQSPHQFYPPTSSALEWGSPLGLGKWNQERDCENGLNHRALSNVSLSTEDSESTCDGDSLERDLLSIQNISSFHDFVTSSSFTGGRSLHKAHMPLCSMEMGSVLSSLPEHMKTDNAMGIYGATPSPAPDIHLEIV